MDLSTAGTLPPGLTMATAGVLSGTPTRPGTRGTLPTGLTLS